MLAALGWDVGNESGQIEALRDVVYEDRVKVGGVTKAPDYGMRLGGLRKFFVEAKKPSVDLRADVKPAYQLRRYAWSAKLPFSVLTDFEEWAVYDCRIKPLSTDGAAVGRLFYLRFDELATRWEELAGLFGRDAVQAGSLERFAAEHKRKRGTEEVDDAFLADLEDWRELFARNIALRNSGLSVRALNEAVQQTLDRIIFLRICEDRGIESDGQLQGYLNGQNVYGRLGELFARADARYNSGLFHFWEERGRSGSVDDWTLGLTIDDKVLKEIIRKLYFPESPYEFSVIPADILGQVYERFLGKVIRLTPGHRAVIEEKPEVRKAGGVFYTPTFVVDYIVQHTVGPLLADKTPKKAAELRIVDPACGSGSFLLGAYQFLLDWHLTWYASHEPKKHKQAVRQTDDGGWRLTTSERKRILTANIFGVDIDPQAVEVTKLSLVLKVLEGETDETLGGQMRLLQERALPDLGHNVQCGNSLIETDVYVGQQLSLLGDDAAVTRINAFDWNSAFPEVYARGGFDAVIGNPPYVRIQAMKEWAPFEVELYKQRYRSASKGNYDLYVVFVERGLSLLNANGRLGFILPHKFFNARYGAPLRALLAEGKHLAEVVHFGDKQIFGGATTYTCLMFLEKAGAEAVRFTKVVDLIGWRAGGEAASGEVAGERVTGAEWNFVVSRGMSLLDRLKEYPTRLGDVGDIFVGLQTSADTVFLFKNQLRTSEDVIRLHSKELNEVVDIESGILRRVVRGGDVDRFAAIPTALVLFPYEIKNSTARLLTLDELGSRFPLALQYLSRNRRLLESRESGKFRDHQWYRFGRNQNVGMWDQDKLMVSYMVTRLSSFSDHGESLYFVNVTTGGFGIVPSQRYSQEFICGLMNSRLLDFVLRSATSTFRGGYFPANKQFIEVLPMPQSIPIDAPMSHTDRGLINLVQRMLDLHKRLPELKSAHDRTVMQRQIEATDREIDRLVYELYELTETEIEIVEGRGG